MECAVSHRMVFILLLTALCTPVTGNMNCTKSHDVALVVDYDGSARFWDLIIKLIEDVSTLLKPSPSGTHIALISFSQQAVIVQALSGSIPLTNWSMTAEAGRSVSAALHTVRTSVFNNQNGDRPEVPDEVVLISLGISDDKNASVTEANHLKSEGIKIVAVGIGASGVGLDNLKLELRAISTNPEDADKLLIVNDIHFKSAVPLLMQTICDQETDTPDGSARLANEGAATGRLELYTKGEWVTVCADSWTEKNTRVACKQLGFLDGVDWYAVQQAHHRRRIGLGNVTCTGSESSIMQCHHNPLFEVDAKCDHSQDVFLRCLCDECTDYTAGDTIRLVNGTPVSGILQEFSRDHGWKAICSAGWTEANVRVVCRQLGFRDGAGMTERARPDYNTPELALNNLTCTGNETKLVDCLYDSTTIVYCEHVVYIKCQCSSCPEAVRQSPKYMRVSSEASVNFEWYFERSVNDTTEFLFMSQKNPQVIMTVTGETVRIANTEFKTRIRLLVNSERAVGFTLKNATRTDMGTYAVNVPRRKLFNSQAILFIDDFPVVPDPVIRRRLNSSMELTWLMNALQQLDDVNYEIMLTTPASGRLRLDYYYTHWLNDNPGRHQHPERQDSLQPMVMIKNVTAKDAGNYTVELRVSSVVHQWLNASWRFSTELIIESDDSKSEAGTSDCNCRPATAAAIVMGVLLGLLIIGGTIGVILFRKWIHNKPRDNDSGDDSRGAPKVSLPTTIRDGARSRGQNMPLTPTARHDAPPAEPFDGDTAAPPIPVRNEIPAPPIPRQGIRNGAADDRYAADDDEGSQVPELPDTDINDYSYADPNALHTQ